MKGKINVKQLWTDKKRTIFGLPLSFTRYILDEERLYIRSGVFTVVEDEVRVYRILDVTLRQTLWQRIFKVGTLHCCSSDSSQKDFDIQSIKNPREVKNLLSELIEAQRMKKRVYYQEGLSMSDDDVDDMMGDLHR